ncbi:exocyst complex component EXO70H1-like [Diospyros lotus]|uniref:exocyst complex component EXO70H1-like n=1 Tax=Diospyros lotus TaxID=55363 RepID=UPI002259687D|nr:exocyst complex component EXO70H1-like [Diospyros lotus]
MPRNGMGSPCFSPKVSSSSVSQFCESPARTRMLTPRRSFSDAVMERSLRTSGSVIAKWNPDTSIFGKVTSLFHENRKKAREFVDCVYDLQKAMDFLATEDSASEKLVRAQNLMEIAMKRLQKEFYQILSMNRAHLDPESVSARSWSLTSTRSSSSDFDYDDGDGAEDEIRIAGDSISEVENMLTVTMADLRLIAECMISSGYGKECVTIYKIIRKSIVDEGIYRLGVDRISHSRTHKMDSEVLEFRMKNWLDAVKIGVKTLFNGERILCDYVFAASESIRESCFTEITKDGAQILFGFPEFVAKSIKKSPEKMFRTLDMYTAISEIWPEIQSIFSFKSASNVRLQAINSLDKLAESIRTLLADLEASISKNDSKSPVAGAGVHSLTIDVMNYLCLLADYRTILADILPDHPPPAKRYLPEPYFNSPDSDEAPASSTSLWFAWLILVLLCKLDGKAKHYKDLSFSYLFLANNLHHVVKIVRSSSLKNLLGDDWLAKHEVKVKQFTANYERLGWDDVIKSIKDSTSPGEEKAVFRRFNTLFDEAYRKQSACLVPDKELREEVTASIAGKLVAGCRDLYNRQGIEMEVDRNSALLVRFTAEDVGNYLSHLFLGGVSSVQN